MLELLKTFPFQPVKPSCPYFGDCGGCDLQHMSYASQLQLKQKHLENLFTDLKTNILPILASTDEYHYRNRVTLHRQGPTFGFLKKQSNEIVAIKNCPIAEDAVNAKITNTVLTDFTSDTLEVRPYASVGFSQVNTSQNEVLKKYICQLLSKSKRARVLELYCGQGNFTFVMTNQVFFVEASDLDANLIDAAKRQQKQTTNKNIKFTVQSAFDSVKLHLSQLNRFDIVFCDPPREGLKTLAVELHKLLPEKIIYVSCAPKTFLHDARQLLRRGYKLESVQPLDMFPQTQHVELVGLFKKE